MSFDIEKSCSFACTKNSFRKLQQCVGVWEVNPAAINDIGDEPEKLAVCQMHFHLDQNPRFHETGMKQGKSFIIKVFKVFLRVITVKHS